MAYPISQDTNSEHRKIIYFIAGPTAIGKSEVAVYLARKLNAEIVSCDSMQVYKGMDIITSKVTLAQRRRIKHHLIDIIKPEQKYNVAKYRKEAITICNKLFSKSCGSIYCQKYVRGLASKRRRK